MRLVAILLSFFSLAGVVPIAAAQELAADITEHQVDITTGFTGTSVTVFGTIDGGGDLIIVAHGPEKEIVVRRKSRQSAIWLNTVSLAFHSVPSYYAVLSSAPIRTLLPVTARKLDQIGSDVVSLSPDLKAEQDDVSAFRSALLDSLQNAGLYSEKPTGVSFLSDRLFRATLTFPANVPTGTYPISVFLVRNNEIVATETLPLVVAESGFEATADAFAVRRPILYGVIAVLVVAVAGWFGTVLFRNP